MLFHSHKDLTNHLKTHLRHQTTIGFVPTMGALHLGHIALMNRALEENDVLVVSIFVNPTQFNNSEDLDKYPRILDQDLKSLQENLSSDQYVVYAPTVQDVYGSETASKNYNFGDLENVMEGAQRPGHFDGVGTILEFLFNVIQPDRAYFGEKDFQQLQIIRKLVLNLDLDVEIIGCPIQREESGLAMSSRNGRLSPTNFKKAAEIYQVLKKAKIYFENHSISETINLVHELVESKPDFTLEYFTIADEQTLQPALEKKEQTSYRAFIVIHLQGVRLIDNIPLY